MTFYLAAPSIVGQPPDDVEATALSHLWIGADGSQWELSAPDSGVRLMRGYRGVSMPAVDRFAMASPGVAGSRFTGYRTVEREVFWPLYIYAAPGQAWLDYDRAFWRTMQPGSTGVWSVTQPNGETRSLTCRYLDDGGWRADLDPGYVGWTRYGVTLVAEDPYWRGDLVESPRWGEGDEAEPYYAVGASYVYYVSSGQTIASASMTNPGDVDAYPTWRVEGPTTYVEVGVGGRIVELPVDLAEGEVRVIYTDPTQQLMVDGDGSDVTFELGEADFAPIPPGQSVPLSLSMTGSGVVSASIRPGYWRAW